MQLNEDAQHVPLPREGHLSTMINGAPSRNAHGHLCQLGVCQLVQCGDQAVYPKGLNRGLEPVLISLSGVSRPGHECSWRTCPQTFIPISGPLLVHTWGPPTQGLSFLLNIYTNFPISLWNVPYSRWPHQHDCWSVIAPILCYAGCLQPSIGGLPQRSQHLQPWGFHPPPGHKTPPSL